jgi:hypothetical protein
MSSCKVRSEHRRRGATSPSVPMGGGGSAGRRPACCLAETHCDADRSEGWIGVCGLEKLESLVSRVDA